jgi:hypothetical protein
LEILPPKRNWIASHFIRKLLGMNSLKEGVVGIVGE